MQEVFIEEYGKLMVAYDYDLGYYPLSPCCNCAAKGSAWGVVCKGCYQNLDPFFAGNYESVKDLVDAGENHPGWYILEA